MSMLAAAVGLVRPVLPFSFLPDTGWQVRAGWCSHTKCNLLRRFHALGPCTFRLGILRETFSRRAFFEPAARHASLPCSCGSFLPWRGLPHTEHISFPSRLLAPQLGHGFIMVTPSQKLKLPPLSLDCPPSLPRSPNTPVVSLLALDVFHTLFQRAPGFAYRH